MTAALEVEDILGLRNVGRRRSSRSLLRLVDLAEQGFPVSTLERIAKTIAPQDSAFKYRVVPKGTLARVKATSARLTSAQSAGRRLPHKAPLRKAWQTRHGSGRHGRMRADLPEVADYELLRIYYYDAFPSSQRVTLPPSQWRIRPAVQRALIKSPRPLADHDFELNLSQKGVDMRIGMDMARLALRELVRALIIR